MSRITKLQTNNNISLAKITELEGGISEKEKAYGEIQEDAKDWEALVKNLRQ